MGVDIPGTLLHYGRSPPAPAAQRFSTPCERVVCEVPTKRHTDQRRIIAYHHTVTSRQHTTATTSQAQGAQAAVHTKRSPSEQRLRAAATAWLWRACACARACCCAGACVRVRVCVCVCVCVRVPVPQEGIGRRSISCVVVVVVIGPFGDQRPPRSARLCPAQPLSSQQSSVAFEQWTLCGP